MTSYVTTTIPYVNARPHLGFVLELVQADVLARHRRVRGDAVRLLTGTDDNSLKNVLAAQAEGVPTARLVDRNAAAFAALHRPLSLSFDDFIRTSRDPRHRPGVERLWQACAASGDLYRKHYAGLYCVGCEQFYPPAELPGGRCPEHGTEPTAVAEENWFFRLSRYQERLSDLVSGGTLRIEPAARRNEVLAFIAGGLTDFSISRSARRAHGWGIPVPGDPDQVVYVWWDALGNYLSALDYGVDGPDYHRWWVAADRRVHLVGKGVVRFHAVYWPAMLLSAGVPLPTDILVHDYLTVAGQRLSKSAGNGVDPLELVDMTDGDTPNIRMPVRMLSVDTPEVTAKPISGHKRSTRSLGSWRSGSGRAAPRSPARWRSSCCPSWPRGARAPCNCSRDATPQRSPSSGSRSA